MPSISPFIMVAISAIVGIILFFSTIYAMGWYNQTKQVKRVTKGDLKERNRVSLKRELEKISGYLNACVKHPIRNIADIQLTKFQTFPSEIARKITEYNKRAEDLVELVWGCEECVKNIIIKNVLVHLRDIEDDEIELQMVLGSSVQKRLSRILMEMLTKEILSGSDIDKPLIDSISSTFYDKIKSFNGGEDFELFLRSLNEDIKFQRMYGCLKLLVRIHNEAKELIEDLQGDKYVQK